MMLFLSQSAFAIAPTVVSAIPDTTVDENSPIVDNDRDLNSVFSDVEDDVLSTNFGLAPMNGLRNMIKNCAL